MEQLCMEWASGHNRIQLPCSEQGHLEQVVQDFVQLCPTPSFLWIPLRRLSQSSLFPAQYVFIYIQTFLSLLQPFLVLGHEYEYLIFPLTLVDAEDPKESAGIKP